MSRVSTLRVAASLLCFLLISTLIPTSSLAQPVPLPTPTPEVSPIEELEPEPSPSPSSTPDPDPQPQEEPQDVVELRSENTKTFRNDDGTYRTEVFSTPVHFKDDQGVWREIDTTLIQRSDGSWTNTAGQFSAILAGQTGETLLSLAFGNHEVEVDAPGAQSGIQPVVSGSVIDYPNAYPAVDIRFVVSPRGVEEFFVLRERPSAPVSFEVPVSLDGLQAEVQEDGSIGLFGGAGKELMSIPPLIMYDSSEEPSQRAVNVVVSESGDSLELDIDPSDAWLTDPARVYPVFVDPSFQLDFTPFQDAWIEETNNDFHPDNPELRIGRTDEGNRSRALVNFRAFGNANYTHVTGASMALKTTFYDTTNCTNPSNIAAHEILADWNSLNVKWSNKPADASTAAATKGVGCSLGSNTWTHADFTALVQKWVVAERWDLVYGVMLRASSGENSRQYFRRIGSKNQLSETDRPKLTITYDVHSATNLAPSDGSVTVNTAPALSAQLSANGHSDSLRFEVYPASMTPDETSNNVTTCPSGATCSTQGPVSSGNTASWTPSLPLGNYKWRVRSASLYGPWSEVKTFSVLPPSPVISCPQHPAGQWSSNNDVTCAWDTTNGNHQVNDSYKYRLLPGGSWTSTSLTTTGVMSDRNDGQYTLEVIRTRSGVDSQTATYLIWIDATAPPAPTLNCDPGGADWSGDNTPQFYFPSSDMSGIQDYTWQFDQTSGMQLLGKNTTSTSSVSLPAQADGIYYFTVEARNGAGATSQPSECAVKIDAVPPTITIESSSHPDGTNEYPLPAMFTWSAPTEQSGTLGYTYAVDAPAPHSNPTSTTSAQFNNLGPGVHTLNVAVKNGAGVWGDKARTFVITDPGPETPSVSCDSHPDPNAWYSSALGNFSWNVTAPPSGISAYSYQVARQQSATLDDTAEQQTNAASSEVDNLPLLQGTQWFQVKAKNGNNRWGGVGVCGPFKVDSTPPNNPLSVASSTHTPYVKFKSAKVRMHWLAAADHDHDGPGCNQSTGCSGAIGYDYLFSRTNTAPDWVNDPLVETTASAITLEIQRDLNDYVPSGQSADGTWYFHIRTVDQAANGSATISYGPIVVGPDGLDFPLAPTLDDVAHTLYAQSDEMGLEKFYAYRDFDLGSSTGFTNLKTGNLVVQDTDFEIPRPGLNAIVRHTYNSQRDEGFYHDEGLGLGWSLSVADGDIGIDGLQEVSGGIDLNAPIQRGEVLKDGLAGLLETAGFIFEFVDGDGTTHRFVKDTQTSLEWISPPGVDLVLRDVAGGLELIRPDGVTYHIEIVTTGTIPTWAVTEITDRNDNKLVFTYDDVAIDTVLRGLRVQSISDGAGDELVTFNYHTDTGSLVSMVATPEDASRTNTFDVQDLPGPLPPGAVPDHRLLKSVVDSSGTVDQRSVSYDYAPQPGGELLPKHMLNKVTDGRGNATDVVVEREGKKFRVKELTDREAKKWQFSYAPVNGNERQTTVKTPSPFLFEFRYTTSLRAEVASGEKKMAGGNIVRISDPGTQATPGASIGRFDTRYIWRENRLTNVRKVVSPDITGYVEANPSTFVETSYRYNALGQIIEINEPPANDTARNDLPANASLGRVLTMLSYDFGDNVCLAPPDDGQALSPMGDGEAFGDVCKIVLTDSVGTATRTTDFLNDAGGNATDVWMRGDGTQAHPDRHVHMTYHPDGTLHEFDGPRDAADMAGQQVNDLTKFTNYSPTGKARTITDPFDNASTFVYNPFGLLTSRTDRESRTWSYSYDRLNNLESGSDPDNDTTVYDWDPVDQLKSVTSPMGKFTEYKYDKNEHMTEAMTPGPEASDPKTSTKFDYRNDGLLWKEYLPVVNGGTAQVINTMDYFGGGLLKSEVRAVGTGQTGTTTYAYDRLGRPSIIDYPSTGSGSPSEQRFYAGNGNLVRSLATSQSGIRDREQKFSYSAFGEQVESLFPISNVGMAQTLFEFSPFGELEKRKRKKDDGSFVTSTNEYDLAGNLTGSLMPGPQNGTLESTFGFDAMNRLRTQTDPINPFHTTTYQYDDDGLQITRQDAVNAATKRTFRWTYNPDLSLRSTSAESFGVDMKLCFFSGTDPSNGYDADGKLLHIRQMRFANCGTSSFGSIGKLRSADMVYDARGWLQSASQSVSSIETNGVSVSRDEAFTFDRAGRIKSWTFDGRSVTYDISAGGALESLVDWRTGSDNRSTFTYSQSNQVRTALLGNQAVRGSIAYYPDGSLQSLAWRPKNLEQPLRMHSNLSYGTEGLLRAETVQQLPAPGAAATDTGGDVEYKYDLLSRLTQWTSPFELQAGESRPVTTYRLFDSGDLDDRIVKVGTSERQSEDFEYAENKLRTITYSPAAPHDVITLLFNDLGEEDDRIYGDVNEGGNPPRLLTTYDTAGHVEHLEYDPTPTNQDGQGWRQWMLHDLEDNLVSKRVFRENGSGPAPPARSTLYFYSALNGDLVAETDGLGGDLARYLLSPNGRLAQETFARTPTGDAGPVKTWSWLLRDTKGSVATIVRDDGNGATTVSKQKSYDPYGRTDLKGSGPMDPDGLFGTDVPESTFGYKDEFTDLTSGRSFIGPRQYDPEIARFTSLDFFVGSKADQSLATDPLTGNRYLFAAANPVAFDDDGHRPVCDGNCAQTLFLPEEEYAKDYFFVAAAKKLAGVSADIAAATGRFVGRNWRTIGTIGVGAACVAATVSTVGALGPACLGGAGTLLAGETASAAVEAAKVQGFGFREFATKSLGNVFTALVLAGPGVGISAAGGGAALLKSYGFLERLTFGVLSEGPGVFCGIRGCGP